MRFTSSRPFLSGALAMLALVTLSVSRVSLGADAAKTADSVAASDGVRIVFESHGQGDPALVFVHGWSCDRSYWKDQLAPFAKDFRVVAIDLAGHGESGVERKAWTIEAFGDDVAAVVHKLDLKRVILIGHSMGGDVILEAARQLRGRIIGLVWADTYRELDDPHTAEDIDKFMAPFRTDFSGSTQKFVRSMFPAHADKALVDRVAADMASAPPTIALSAMHSALNYGRQAPTTVQALKAPVFAINPDEPASDLESLKRYGVEVLSVPRVGHFLMMENPAGFNAALREAIDKSAK